MNLPKKLKKLRRERNLTQRELAKTLSISPTCYAGYEQGYRQPDLKTFKKIANYFNVSTDFLMNEENVNSALEKNDTFNEDNFSMLAEKIKELRLVKGLSQKELALQAGVSQSAIAKIELKKNEATASTLAKLADFFNCSIDYLVGRSTEESKFISLKEFQAFEEYCNMSTQDKLLILQLIKSLNNKKDN